MTKSRIRLIGGLFILLTTGWGVLLWWNAGAPRRTAEQLVANIQRLDWKSLMKVASEDEKRLNGWNRDSFPRFAARLTRHLDLSSAKGDLIEKKEGDESAPVRSGSLQTQQRPMWNPQSQRMFSWVLPPSIRSPEGASPRVQIAVLRDEEGRWTATVGSVLVLLNRCNRDDPKASAKNLKLALEEANLPYYCEFRVRQIIRPERLAAYLRGEIQNMEVWENLPQE